MFIVPNLSEGRDETLVRRLTQPVRGVRRLHLSADPDHHRAVAWYAGAGVGLQEQAVVLAERCAAAIDLRRHRGVHPRAGALDVVPFVAHDEPEPEVVSAALDAARGIADLGIPVYLYGRAHPAGLALPAVRAALAGPGPAAGVASLVPDFGPPVAHTTAGATCVGVRQHLIAFNVNLRAPLAVARRIAATIRESSGGLPGIRALGLPLDSEGEVQVSTNVTDPDRTGPAAVYDAVRRLAGRLGAEVVDAEVVGLIAARHAAELSGVRLRQPAATIEQALGEPGQRT